MADTGTTDYDHVRLMAIGPGGITGAATNVKKHAQEVADALGRVIVALEALTAGGWQGATQREAEDFNARWTTVTQDLFGTKENPETGVLNAIAGGIGTAGANYNKAELGLNDLWKKFAGGLAPDGGGDGKDDPPPSKEPPADVLDTNKTAITADY